MRILVLLVKLALFGALLGFAIRNTDLVTVRYYLGYEWRAPLVAVLFVFFGAGAVLGVLATTGIILRQRRRLARLERLQSTVPATAAVLPAEAAVDTQPGPER